MIKLRLMESVFRPLVMFSLVLLLGLYHLLFMLGIVMVLLLVLINLKKKNITKLLLMVLQYCVLLMVVRIIFSVLLLLLRIYKSVVFIHLLISFRTVLNRISKRRTLDLFLY